MLLPKKVMDDQRIVIPDIIELLLGEDKDVIDTSATEANDNRGIHISFLSIGIFIAYYCHVQNGTSTTNT